MYGDAVQTVLLCTVGTDVGKAETPQQLRAAMPRRLTLAQTTATGNGIDAALAAQPLSARIRDVHPDTDPRCKRKAPVERTSLRNRNLLAIHSSQSARYSTPPGGLSLWDIMLKCLQ